MWTGSGSRPPAAAWRTAPTGSRRPPAPVVTAPRRRCAAPSSRPWASAQPSTAADSPRRRTMHIVIPLFDRFAPLDAVGPYQVLVHLPGATVTFAAQQRGGVSDSKGTFTLQAQASFAEVPHPDVILVPGGSGESDQLSSGPLEEWLLEADKTSTWTTSVCTGALILARAGLLEGREA